MRFIRETNLDEFIRWYLSRERRKLGLDGDLQGVSDAALRQEMDRFHGNKLRPWFDRARWNIVSFDSVEELMTFICVDGTDTRRNRLVNGLDPDFRIVGRVIASALHYGHFEALASASQYSLEANVQHQRMERLKADFPQLCGAERLALCTPSEHEYAQNPSGTWYLHDGFGRLLPWLYLVVIEGYQYLQVEAFLIEEL